MTSLNIIFTTERKESARGLIDLLKSPSNPIRRMTTKNLL